MPEQTNIEKTSKEMSSKTAGGASAAAPASIAVQKYKVVHGILVAPHGDVIDKDTGRRHLVEYHVGSVVELDPAHAKRALKDKLIKPLIDADD
jgi:hypothetical protein